MGKTNINTKLIVAMIKGNMCGPLKHQAWFAKWPHEGIWRWSELGRIFATNTEKKLIFNKLKFLSKQ